MLLNINKSDTVYQPSKRGKNWRLTIKEQRLRIIKCLKENPSLKPSRCLLIKETYETAILQAANETGLDESMFSTTCLWSFEQIMDDDFWPN